MPKHTKKPDNGSTVGEKLALEPGLLILDNADKPIRSRKYAARPRARFKALEVGSDAKKTLWVQVDGVNSALPFNTSAQLPTNTSQADFEKKLQKRARSKFVTNTIAVPLSQIASPLENSYKTTLRCSGHLTQSKGKLTGLYCGQRWCVVCARIRTARMVAGYLPQIERMEEKWFVTLTRPNVPAGELPATIKAMTDRAANIHRVLKERRKMKYSSLRKLECTYNATARTYHPHFHFILDSELAARALYAEWFDRFAKDGIQLSHDGNEVKKADNNSVKELFKYFTKIASGKKYNKKSGKLENYYIHIGPMDIMFQAMRGRRVFQPSGIVKAVSEEVEPNFALPSPSDLEAHYSWMGNDWIDKTTNQVLCGYEPSAAIKEIASHVVMPKLRTPAVIERDAPGASPAGLPIEVIDYETGEVTIHVSPPALPAPVRFGQLQPVAEADLTHHEYGPVLPLTYRAPRYCFKTFSGSLSRRYFPYTPPVTISQLGLFSGPKIPTVCRHSTLLLQLPCKPLRVVRLQQHGKK
jgi:hypothetical protein